MSSCTAIVGVLGSQLFRAAGNTETGFSDLISIVLLTASQCEDAYYLVKHFIGGRRNLAIIYQRGCMSGLVGVSPISVLPSECLFERFQLDYGFWLKM